MYGEATHELAEITKKFKDKVTINTVNLKEEEMNNIYNLGDCFVSPSHAEGFNMTCLEAMACGLPIITPDWGGQMDFIPEDNEFIPVTEFEPPRFTPWDHGKWGKIDIEKLRASMRHVFENQEEFRLVGMKNSFEARKWSWEEAAKKVLKII